MQYFGGKHKHALWLKQHVLPVAQNRRLLEPFCGGLSATVALQPQLASDVSPALIALYKAIRYGWEPPLYLSYDEYKRLQELKDPDNPLTAFAGFGCSFGGKWFAGYARDSRRGGVNFAELCARKVKEKVFAIANTDLQAASYLELFVRPGDVLYCDPPYGETTHGYNAPKWDKDKFWGWAQWCAVRGATVLVSEFSAPPDTVIIAERPGRSGVDGHNTGTRETVEKLYRLG